MAKPNKTKIETQYRNSLTYNTLYNSLKLTAINLFEWDNLPNKIPARFIELSLYRYGLVGFYKDDSLGLVCAKVTQGGQLNHYDEPTSWEVISNNGMLRGNIKAANICILRNNNVELPTKLITQYYTDKIYKIERTIDVNINSCKTPVIVKCDESQRLTLKNLFREYDEGIPIIYGTKDLDLDGIDVLNLNPQYYAQNLKDLVKTYINEYYTILGVNNSNIDKKERLVSDEVNANNEVIEIMSRTMLETRQLFCKEFNEKFNTNIQVRRKKEKEVGENVGHLHSNALQLETSGD